MKKLTRKLCSVMTAMIIGMLCFSAIPAETDATTATSTTVRTLSVDFLGTGANPASESKGQAHFSKDDVGTKFWVGVAVDNVSDLPVFTNGIYSLELAFEYHPNYVKPYFTTNNAEAEWLQALQGANLGAANDSLVWNTSQYEMISVMETDMDTVTDRENSDVMTQRKTNGWKMCTVSMHFTGTAWQSTRFMGLTENTKQYLLRLPFKLEGAPDESAVDQNPTVLSLVRGPETLDIGAGSTGTEHVTAWEATVEETDGPENMKTLFTFAGDISLYGQGGAIGGIIPKKPMTGTETEDTPYTLSHTTDLNEEGFREATWDYYLSVPNAAATLKLDITAPDLPKVTANGAPVSAALSGTNLYTTAAFPLLELNKDVNGGFNNTVTVSDADGTITYTIYIRRMLQPRIELNPGNSPTGLIERMHVKYLGQTDGWSDEKVEKAKQDFADSDPDHGNLQYKEGFIPDNAITNVKYTTAAWGSYEQNYDLDPKAIFVYEATDFVDPGIMAYDEMGEVIEDVVYNRKVTFDKQSVGEPNYSSTLTEDKRDILSQGNSYVFSIKNTIIRPDVYEMEYTYNYVDENANTYELTKKRAVIVLSKRGDIQLTTDPTFNGNDVTSFAVSYTKWGLPGTNTLFSYRVCDVQETTDATINGNDYTTLAADAAKYSDFPYSQYYFELPELPSG